MMSGEAPQHITEQIELCKKELRSYSNFYSKLPQFIHKNKSIQEDMLYDIYINNSKLEGLLRDIMEQELNEETLRQVSSFGHNQVSDTQRKCNCPFCNRNPEEDEYWDEEEEDE